jgi:hypothetical protein
MPLFNQNWFTPTGMTPQSPSYVSTGAQPKTVQQIMQEQSEAYDIWMQSALGRNTMAAEESATAYSRKVSDDALARAWQALNQRAEELRLQGRRDEADILLKQGAARLAEKRFEWEQRTQQQDYGLRRADAIARYSSTPDQMFLRSDLMSALGQAERGQGPQPYGANGRPRMKTSADYDAIAGPSGSLAQGNGYGMSAQTGAVTDGGGSDPRIKAARSVIDAIPPSDDVGTDDNDTAALMAIENIFRAKRPDLIRKMRPGQREAFGAGLSRLGYYAPDALAELERAGVGQGSTRRAA